MKRLEIKDGRQIEWLEKKGHKRIGETVGGEFIIFEIEEDVVIPTFEDIPLEKKKKKIR